MYNVHLLTTDDRILPPPNLGANFTWERLTDTLRRDLGAEAADLLAEPVQDGERKETRWYVQAETDPVPVSGLSPSERETVFRRLSEVRSRIETYAEGLDKAGGKPTPALLRRFGQRCTCRTSRVMFGRWTENQFWPRGGERLRRSFGPIL